MLHTVQCLICQSMVNNIQCQPFQKKCTFTAINVQSGSQVSYNLHATCQQSAQILIAILSIAFSIINNNLLKCTTAHVVQHGSSTIDKYLRQVCSSHENFFCYYSKFCFQTVHF